MDEEELLLDSALPVDVKLGDLDEAAILDDDIPLEGGGVSATNNMDGVDESEELDYDEEPDEDAERERAPRAGKFTSERVSMRRSSVASSDISPAGPSKEQTSRDRLQSTPSTAATTPSVPTSNAAARAGEVALVTSSLPQPAPNVTTASIASSVLTKPAVVTRAPPKVLINPHYKGPIRPRSELTINWNTAVGVRSVTTIAVPPLRTPFVTTSVLPALNVPPPSLTFPAIASSSTDFSRPPPAVVPIANFATPPPQVYGGVYATAVAPATVSSTGQWDQLVEGFLRRTTARRISRSRSRSSSSAYSRSRSRSYSSRSRSSSSSGSSHSSSRWLRHEPRFQVRRSASRHNDSRIPRNGSHGRVRYGDRQRAAPEARVEHRDRRPRTPEVSQQEKTMECAKAIGLDSEYLSKLEEQKKMRQEILRKKEERRVQSVQRASLTITSELKQSASGIAGATYAQTVKRSEKTLKEGPLEMGSGERNVEKRASRNARSIKSRDSPSGLTQSRIGHQQPGRNCPLSRTEVQPTSPRNQSPNVRRSSPFRTSAIGGNRGQEQPQRITMVSSVMRKREVEHVSPSGREASNGAVRKQPEKAATIRTSIQSAVDQVQAKTRPSSGDRPAVAKKKAYLAVVVRTSSKTTPDMERMKLIAATVGPTKKVWRSHNDCISIIFESHDNAKKFMLQYNGKVINGVRLFVMLEKVFVNLAEL